MWVLFSAYLQANQNRLKQLLLFILFIIFCSGFVMFVVAPYVQAAPGDWQNSAKRLGGANNDYISGVVTDTNDRIIITGLIYGDSDVNGDGDAADGGAESGTGYGFEDSFISVFNSSGSFQWAKRLGGALFDLYSSVITDTNDNIITAPAVWGNADVNGDGDSADGGAESSSGYGGFDSIISVFDSSGTFQWAKRLGGTGTDISIAVFTDTNNNIIVTGYVTGDADLNGDGDAADGGAESATGYGNEDIFISVFDSSGTFQWARRLGGTGYDYGEEVTTDANNNIIVTGYVTGDADLNGDGDAADGGAESSTGYGSGDIVISVFDSSGTFQWAKRLGGTDNDTGYGIITDANSNIIVTGYVTGDADLNGDGDATDGGAESSTGYGNRDTVISAFNASGTFQWAERLGGADDDVGYGLAVNSDGDIIVGGESQGDGDMNGDGDATDGGAETASLDPGANGDAYFSVFEGFYSPTASAANITNASDPIYGQQTSSLTAVYTDTNGYADFADLYLKLDHPTDSDIEMHFTESGSSGSGLVTVDSGSTYLNGTPSYSYTTSGNNLTVTWIFSIQRSWTQSLYVEYSVKATDAVGIASTYSSTDLDIYYKQVGPSGMPGTKELQDLSTPSDAPRPPDLPGTPLRNPTDSPTPPVSSAYNPQGGFNILINGGAEGTQDSEVKLYLFAGGDAEYMQISEDPTFQNASQQPYTPHIHWNLQDSSPGTHTIYIKYLTEGGTASEIITQSINLNQTNTSILSETSCRMVTVRTGDSLWSLAQAFLQKGFFYQTLIDLNQGAYQSLKSRPGYLIPGWSLKIECS